MANSVSRKVFKALTYNAFRVGISTAISIIYSITVVRYLDIQKFGAYVFLDSIFVISTVLFGPGIRAPIIRFIPELITKKDYSRLRRLIEILQKLNLLAAVTATLLILFSADFIFVALGKPELAFYARIMALGIIPSTLFAMAKKILTAVYEQKYLSILETLLSVLELSLLIIFAIILDLDLVGIIMIYFISYTIGAIASSVYIRQRHRYLFEGEQSPVGSDYIQRMLRYATPLTILDFINNIEGSINNIFLGIFSKLEDTALFDIPNSFVNRVLSRVWDVISPIGIVSLTEIDYSTPTNMRFAVQQYVKIVSLYTIPVAIGGIMIAEPLLVSFYGYKVLASVQIFRIMLLAYGVLNMVEISRIILNVKEQTHIILFGEVVRILIMILLSLWLIPSLGIMGTAISIIVSSVITNAYYTYFAVVRLRMGNFFPLKNIGKYLASGLLMGVTVVIIVLLHMNSLWTLISSLIAGPFTYVLALRLVRAFDQMDKELFMNMKIPFKFVILKLLWKE
ncbi:oligosaccharide flippase family protein [Candidatus Bathyarchaeota archaeon]|nr:oligosaccharide flippase family protein [Candidatus Bathyarchaeota archaeon]